MPRSGYVAALDEVVEHKEGDDDGDEERRRAADDHQHLNHVAERADEGRDRVRDRVVRHVDVLRESIQYAAGRRRVEERHGGSHNTFCAVITEQS